MEKAPQMICAKCGRQPTDMLILICDHNLCLLCASKTMVSETFKNRKQHVIPIQKVICEICSMQTELDPSSVLELLKYLEEEFSESRYDHEVQYPKEDYSAAPDYCREHPDELLGYFCLECETECICAECAIHGDHRSHDVLQIKKAYPQIKDKIEEIYLHLTNKIDEVQLRAEKIENHKKEIIDQGNSAKQQVLVSFEDLKARIEKKEREIIGNIERIVKETLREAENFSRIISGKVNALEGINENIHRVLTSASMTELLDFYAENKEKIYVNIDHELSTLTNIDRTANLRCVISTSSLAEHIESIKAVQLHISSLKGVDDGPEKRTSEGTRRAGLGTANLR